MVELLSHLYQYVPVKEYTHQKFIPSRNEYVDYTNAVVHGTLLGGDQLTAARASGALKAMANAATPVKQLSGLIPVIEDWHVEVIILEVIM